MKYLNKISLTFLILTPILLVIIGCRKKAPEFDNTPKELKVMSFNIRYDNIEDAEHQWNNRKTSCLKMLNCRKPDILGIQEGLYHQVQYIENELPFYNRVGVGRDDGIVAGEFAAIFYNKLKFEKLANGDFWLSETSNVPSLGWDAEIKRIVTWVKLKDTAQNSKPFYVFNTHFDHRGREARKESAKLLVNKISTIRFDESEAVFVLGDFNASITNPIFKPIHEKLFESRFNAKESDNTKTFNGWGWRASKIDFIFYDRANIEKFKVIDDDFGVPYISDHYPLESTFKY